MLIQHTDAQRYLSPPTSEQSMTDSSTIENIFSLLESSSTDYHLESCFDPGTDYIQENLGQFDFTLENAWNL